MYKLSKYKSILKGITGLLNNKHIFRIILNINEGIFENMKIKEEIGLLLQNRRQALGLNIEEAARKADFSKHNIYAIENGKGYQIDTLIKYLKALEINDINIIGAFAKMI